MIRVNKLGAASYTLVISYETKRCCARLAREKTNNDIKRIKIANELHLRGRFFHEAE